MSGDPYVDTSDQLMFIFIALNRGCHFSSPFPDLPKANPKTAILIWQNLTEFSQACFCKETTTPSNSMLGDTKAV